jgi:hypothetical protein
MKLKNHRRSVRLVAALSIFVLAISSVAVPAGAQDNGPASAGATISVDQPGVPRLINFSGTVKNASGKVATGEVTLTFSLYEDQEGGSPLWSETQTVQADNQGGYTVLLGATQAEGLPQDLFTSTRARWLGVAPQLPAVGELPRVLLVGMPYALKASDADTLGGKPASDYVTADALSTLTQTNGSTSVVVTGGPLDQASATLPGSAATTSITGTGETDFVPLWTNSTTLGNSVLFQSGGKVGIGNTKPASTLDVTGGVTVRGGLQLPSTGTATATAGFKSQPADWLASSFNSSTNAPVSQDFRWQAEPSGNDSSSPLATLNLLFGTNGANPAATGLSINSTGQINFAAGQIFPGTGNGTITGVTAGTGLSGGGTSGNVTLNVNEGVVAFQSDLTNAENTLNASISTAQTNAINTSEAYAKSNFLNVNGGTVNGNLVVQGAQILSNQPALVLSVVGGNGGTGFGFPGAGIAFAAGNGAYNYSPGNDGGAGGSVNLTAGSGGASDNLGGNGGTITLTAGFGGAASEGDLGGNGGQIILQPGAAGVGFGGSGVQGNVLIVGDDNGVFRATPPQLQIQGHSNSNKQLLIGYLADSGSDLGYGALQATVDGTANTPLALNPNGGGVGIQTTTVTNSLTIGQGQGAALADGWNTYSSRRWKTNIQTLPDALDKVEHLRGVSYDLKENGKHEIGVIAEEVGAVVPEIVQWDKNGKDANGVDYSRLTALLIEAVKQQQSEIRQERALRQAAEQREARALARMHSVVQNLEAQVKSERAAVAALKARVATDPRLVAAR